MCGTTKIIPSLLSSTALTSDKSRVNRIGIWYYFVDDFSQLRGMKPEPMWVMYSGQWSLRRSPSPALGLSCLKVLARVQEASVWGWWLEVIWQRSKTSPHSSWGGFVRLRPPLMHFVCLLCSNVTLRESGLYVFFIKRVVVCHPWADTSDRLCWLSVTCTLMRAPK